MLADPDYAFMHACRRDTIKQGTKHMSAELSYKNLEQKVEYQDMYIEQLHHVIAGLKRDQFGKKLEGFENPFQAQLPFQIAVGQNVSQ